MAHEPSNRLAEHPWASRTRRVVEFAFATLARRRSGRAVHTRGTVLDATLTVEPGSATGRALGHPQRRSAVVRASKSIGLPGRIPDLLGMAVRIPTADGVFDVLFASVGRRGPARLVLRPSGTWWGQPFSTVLPYVVDGQQLLLGLQADPGVGPPGADPAAVAAAVHNGPVQFVLSEIPVRGPHRPIGGSCWSTSGIRVRRSVSIRSATHSPGCTPHDRCAPSANGPTPDRAVAAAPTPTPCATDRATHGHPVDKPNWVVALAHGG